MKVLGAFLVLSLLTPVALADELVFGKIKYMEREPGKDKLKDRKARLHFQDDRLCVMDNKDKKEYVALPYSGIDEIVYEKSAHARWKTAIFVTPFALFSKGKKHWLTVTWKDEEGKGDYLILRLDKNNYREIVAACETRTGKEVEWIMED
jgi:hypothetical protein